MIKNDPTDNTLVTYSHLVARGYIPRLTTGGRDSIPTYFNKLLGDGLLVFTRDTEKIWRWKASNSTWEDVTTGGISLADLSATTPLGYNNTTGVFSIQPANTTDPGYLSAADWNTFNGKAETSDIPAQFNPIAGTNISLTGTYPNITFDAAGGTNQDHTTGYGLTGSIYNGTTARTWNVDTTSSGGIVSKSRLNTVIGSGLLHTTGNEFKTGSIYFEGGITAYDTFSQYPYTNVQSTGIVVASDSDERSFLNPDAAVFQRGNSFSGTLQVGNNTLTDYRTYTLPDESGTLALTSNIPSTTNFAQFGQTSPQAGSLLINNAYTARFNNSTFYYPFTTMGTAGLDTYSSSSISAQFRPDRLNFLNNSYSISFLAPTLTGVRTIDIPDASGTIALTNNIPTQVNPIAGTNMSITGTYPNLTFNASGGGGGGIALTDLSATSPILYNNTTGVFSSQAATSGQNGYLTSTDWTTFNNKASLVGTDNYIPYKTSGAFASTGFKWNLPTNTYTFEAYDVLGDGGSLDATVNTNVITTYQIKCPVSPGGSIYFGGATGVDDPQIIFNNDIGFAAFGKNSGANLTTDAYTFYKPTMADKTTTGTGTASGYLFKVNGGIGTRAIPTGSSSSASTGGVGALVSIVSGNGGAFSGNTTNTGRGGAGGAYSLVSGTGGAAANAGAGTQIGGAGGAYSITTGNGGAVTNASATTGTGGAAGNITMTGGTGGNATSTTTSTGGTGGTTTISSGSGGNATAGTTRTGGDAGDIVFTTGTGGTGTTAVGRDGRMIFPIKTAPATATSTGTAGEIRFTTTGIYICTATNTWIKCTGATF